MYYTHYVTHAYVDTYMYMHNVVFLMTAVILLETVIFDWFCNRLLQLLISEPIFILLH